MTRSSRTMALPLVTGFGLAQCVHGKRWVGVSAGGTSLVVLLDDGTVERTVALLRPRDRP